MIMDTLRMSEGGTNGIPFLYMYECDSEQWVEAIRKQLTMTKNKGECSDKETRRRYNR